MKIENQVCSKEQAIKLKNLGVKQDSIMVYGYFVKRGNMSSIVNDDNSNLYIIDENSVMQYTGLKDKNGKEIYEGDIVTAMSQGYRGIFQIWYRQAGSPSYILYPAYQNREHWYIRATEYGPGKQFISVTGEITTPDKVGFYDDGLEVIGNIYENPELLQPC